MSRKRRNSSSIEPDSPPVKQQSFGHRSDGDGDHVHTGVGEYRRPVVDNLTGQAGAFPGLEDDGDELFYGPATDGLDYLRMVRSERKGIPDLLTTADLKAQEENGRAGGYYNDGAYTAAPDIPHNDRDPFRLSQIYYYDSLLAHFRLVRATVKCVPPLNNIQMLGTGRLISFPANSKSARDTWETHIRDNSPHPVQIACMDGDSILQLLRLISRRLTQFFKTSDTASIDRIGSWLWAALGKCPDRGELGSEEISDLRALAKKAEEVQKWLDAKVETTMAGIEACQQENVGGMDQGQEIIEHLADHNRAIESESEVSGMSEQFNDRQYVDRPENTNSRKEMVLDMIIAVVGEIYGQRDLLELRKSWSAPGDSISVATSG